MVMNPMVQSKTKHLKQIQVRGPTLVIKAEGWGYFPTSYPFYKAIYTWRVIPVST